MTWSAVKKAPARPPSAREHKSQKPQLRLCWSVGILDAEGGIYERSSPRWALSSAKLSLTKWLGLHAFWQVELRDAVLNPGGRVDGDICTWAVLALEAFEDFVPGTHTHGFGRKVRVVEFAGLQVL